MNRPRRVLWVLGLALLVSTAAGARWILNRSAAEGSPAEHAADDVADRTVSLGWVDVEPGVAGLYPVQHGRVQWVAPEGKEITKEAIDKGEDALLRLDDRLAQEDLKRAKAMLHEAQLRKAQAEILVKQHPEKLKQLRLAAAAALNDKQAAEQELEVKNKLFNDKQINEQTKRIVEELVRKATAIHELAQSKLEEAKLAEPKLEVQRAEADIAAGRALVARAELALKDYVVRAPGEGTVLRVFAKIGETLGSNPHGPALEFLPSGPRIIRAEVQQEFAAKVKPGQEAIIEDDTAAGPQWKGRVQRISDWYTQRRHNIQEPFQYNDVRTLECIVEVAGSPPLRIGQRVRVLIKQGGP
jgi:multidrug efflux pump subunit AcrA (membrane-fusion protein)